MSHPMGGVSVAAMPCPKCGRSRCVPKGSQTPRCFVCEPQQLWLDAQKAWEQAEEKW